jgi:hypothetical protein
LTVRSENSPKFWWVPPTSPLTSSGLKLLAKQSLPTGSQCKCHLLSVFLELPSSPVGSTHYTEKHLRFEWISLGGDKPRRTSKDMQCSGQTLMSHKPSLETLLCNRKSTRTPTSPRLEVLFGVSYSHFLIQDQQISTFILAGASHQSTTCPS